MHIDEAKVLLNTCKREELQDHAFGDAEVYWMQDGKEVAYGYFSRDVAEVNIVNNGAKFEGSDAYSLRSCCLRVSVRRNDSGH